MSEVVGLPRPWLIKLTAAALGKVALSKEDAEQASYLLLRLLHTNRKASLDKPKSSIETIDVDRGISNSAPIGIKHSFSVICPPQP